MDAERFAYYIKNPAHLYQITYTELKSLVLQYPYCQNLRYLLLKKSILEDHAELEQNKQLAATFSVDRNYLYQQIKEGDPYKSEADSFLLKKDYLELKKLSADPSTSEKEVLKDFSLQDKGSDEEISSKPEKPESDLFQHQEEAVPAEKPAKLNENKPEKDSFEDLEQIEEEEFEDITSEFDGVFEESADAANTDKQKKETAAKPSKPPKSNNDEAISIEELIELDNLSPLERMNKEKEKTKSKSKDKPDKTSEAPQAEEELTKSEFVFEEMDDLIQKTKEKVPLEITNEDFLDITQDDTPKPSPKASFGSWLKQIKSKDKKEEQVEEQEKKAAKPKRKKKKSVKKKGIKKTISKQSKKNPVTKAKETSSPQKEKAKDVAQRSLEENAEIVSETLAELLVKQENYKKAIKMYEQLSLIFPEKSSFFADQIKNIKKL